jgi:hypothetical protein
MRMVDVICPSCELVREDALLRDKNDAGDYIYPACAKCGATTIRVYTGHASHVHGDDIPGGILIYNGICNKDGSPKRYYSKSEMARVAKQKGLVNNVRHIGGQGSDKNKHTQRFV